MTLTCPASRHVLLLILIAAAAAVTVACYDEISRSYRLLFYLGELGRSFCF